MNTVILDADLVLHRAASASQANYRFDSGQECVSVDFNAAKDKAQELIRSWTRKLFPDKIVLALSDPTGRYWRKAVLPSYKASRGKTPKPLLFKNLRAWVEENYEVVCMPGLEADDVCGILSGHERKYPGVRIVVSTDKDLLSIPGYLYRPHRADDGVLTVTLKEADHWHMMQTLMGDPTDGFTGIPGVGPKKAEKILAQPCDECRENPPVVTPCGPWNRVTAAYEKAGLTEKDALTQARVARILRFGEYHKNLRGDGVGAVKLWSPGAA